MSKLTAAQVQEITTMDSAALIQAMERGGYYDCEAVDPVFLELQHNWNTGRIVAVYRAQYHDIDGMEGFHIHVSYENGKLVAEF